MRAREREGEVPFLPLRVDERVGSLAESSREQAVGADMSRGGIVGEMQAEGTFVDKARAGEKGGRVREKGPEGEELGERKRG